MKKILLVTVMLIASSLVWGQQMDQYKYLIYDNYFVNPAYVGTNDYYSLRLGWEKRFAGINNSPQTLMFAAHSRVGQGYLFEKDGKINRFFKKFGNSALGTQILYSSFGPQREMYFALSYGHHISLDPVQSTLKKRKLVLGMTPSMNLVWFDLLSFINENGSGINVVLPGDQDDPVLPNTTDESYFNNNFSLDVGALYQGYNFDFGASVIKIPVSINNFESVNFDYYLADSLNTFKLKELYSPKAVVNLKLKNLRIFNERLMDLEFIPSTVFLYNFNNSGLEFFFDAAIKLNFWNEIAKNRLEKTFSMMGGINFNHTRYYKPVYLLQPYLSFEFLQYDLKLLFNPSFNTDLNRPSWQVSFCYRLGKEVEVKNFYKEPWRLR